MTQSNKDLIIVTKNFKESIQSYETTDDITYLKEAVQLYYSTIRILADKIRTLKYKYNHIEQNNDNKNTTTHLIQEQYTQSQLLIPVNTP